LAGSSEEKKAAAPAEIRRDCGTSTSFIEHIESCFEAAWGMRYGIAERGTG